MDPEVAGALITAVATIAAAIIGVWVALKVKNMELGTRGSKEDVPVETSRRSPSWVWGIGGAVAGAVLVLVIMRSIGDLLPPPAIPTPASTSTPMSIIAEPRILFDETHGGLSLDPVRAATLEPNAEYRGYIYAGVFAEEIGQHYILDVSTDGPIAPQLLADYRVLILSAENGWYSPEEAETILNFVRSGGGLLILGIGGAGSQALITKPLGVSYVGRPIASHDHLDWGPWGFKIDITASDNLLTGVSTLTANAVGLMKVDDPANAIVWSDADTWLDSDEDQMQDENERVGPFPLVAKIRYGLGRVVVFPLPVTGDFFNANRSFVMQAIDWLTE